MAKLKKIWINPISERQGLYEIRMDWDNERHQAIGFKNLEPEEVSRALLSASRKIEEENYRGEI